MRNLLASLAALYAVVTLTPLTAWWTLLLQGGPADTASGQVMVVLAGSTMERGLLGQGSYWRSAFALREARRGGYARIILSGGGSSNPSAAGAMKAYLVSAGVDANRIELEGNSTSTWENMLFSGRLLQGETRLIALVTSDYHMYRSARLFEKAGIPVIRRPYPDAAARGERWRQRWEIAYELAVETTKIVYYKLRGRI